MAQKLNEKIGSNTSVSTKVEKFHKNDQPQQRLLNFVDDLLNSMNQPKQKMTTVKH